MRREIEACIAKRKESQQQLKTILETIGTSLEQPSIFKKKDTLVLWQTLYAKLTELITIQDQEWDLYANNHSGMVFQSLQWKIDKLESETAKVQSLLTNFITLEKSLQNIISDLDQKAPSQIQSEKLKSIQQQLSPFQYCAFEARFRGQEADIQNNLKPYLNYFLNTDHILDIGCGRGEFVELLIESGKHAQGIDISKSMLNVATDKGLPCFQADALEFLQSKPAGSIGGIFSAQVIEHLSADYLEQLIKECLRVLKNNAPLILETVNPLSWFSFSQIYLLDPTHQKPLHPEYIRYFLEATGYSNVSILYGKDLEQEKLELLPAEHPQSAIFNNNIDKINQLLFAAPVYAAIGYKPPQGYEL
jgi:O-antigen chain-terminating methyltransferase